MHANWVPEQGNSKPAIGLVHTSAKLLAQAVHSGARLQGDRRAQFAIMGKNGKVKLDAAIVSDAEVASAQAALKNAAERKRQNSNMHFYLQNIGKKNAYDRLSSAEKKEFFLKWFAKKAGESTVTSNASQSVTTVTESGDNFEWMGKDAMIQKLGERKAMSKIESGKLETRPDQDTGKAGEWDIEYKVFWGQGRSLESQKQCHSLDTTGEVSGEGLKEAMEDMAAASTHTGEGTNVCTSFVKREREEEPATSTTSTESKTFEAIKKNPRSVLRACGDTIVTMKTMYETTHGGKYTEALHADLTKLLPKFKSHYTALEKIVTKPTADLDDAVCFALAKKLDVEYGKFNEYSEWFQKLFPKASKKGKKAKDAEANA